MKGKLFSFLAVLAIVLSAVLTTPAYASGCQTYTRHITGDSDSGIGGYWATDTYTSSYEVCQTAPSTYTVNRTDTGNFVTWGSTSPSGGSTVVAGVNGTFAGSWAGIVVHGTINPAAPLDLGSVDFQCDHNGVCANYSSSLAQIFNAGYGATYPDNWVWAYTACQTNMIWTNSASGNSGDIASKVPTTCPVPPKHKLTCASEYAILHGSQVDKSSALRYFKHHKFCANQWEPGYYWKFHDPKNNSWKP